MCGGVGDVYEMQVRSVVDVVVINDRRCYQRLIVWHVWTNIVGPGGWGSALVWGVGMIGKSDRICRRTYMKSAVDFVVINVRRCYQTLIVCLFTSNITGAGGWVSTPGWGA